MKENYILTTLSEGSQLVYFIKKNILLIYDSYKMERESKYKQLNKIKNTEAIYICLLCSLVEPKT